MQEIVETHGFTVLILSPKYCHGVWPVSVLAHKICTCVLMVSTEYQSTSLPVCVSLLKNSLFESTGPPQRRILSWTVDNEGTLYSDGVQVGHSSDWQETTQTTLPFFSSLLAFSLKDDLGQAGLLASLDNSWSTGDPGLRCTDDASMVLFDDWKHYSM